MISLWQAAAYIDRIEVVIPSLSTSNPTHPFPLPHHNQTSSYLSVGKSFSGLCVKCEILRAKTDPTVFATGSACLLDLLRLWHCNTAVSAGVQMPAAGPPQLCGTMATSECGDQVISAL